MNYYLIDYENIHNDGLKDLTKISTGDHVVIFYSEQCKNISLEVIETITKYNAVLSSQKVKIGTKNALDFQLSSYLGYLIGKANLEDSFYIISNDKGFDCLCDFWKEQNIHVYRTLLITNQKVEEIDNTTKKQKKSKVADCDIVTLSEINKYLSKNESPETVLEILNKYKTKQAICNAMSKKFKDSKKTGCIYKKLKPLFKEKNKT